MGHGSGHMMEEGRIGGLISAHIGCISHDGQQLYISATVAEAACIASCQPARFRTEWMIVSSGRHGIINTHSYLPVRAALVRSMYGIIHIMIFLAYIYILILDRCSYILSFLIATWAIYSIWTVKAGRWVKTWLKSLLYHNILSLFQHKTQTIYQTPDTPYIGT